MRLSAIVLTIAVLLIVSNDALSGGGGGHHQPPPAIPLPDLPVDPDNPTAPVGYLDASSSVSATGEFTYTIPIEVPRGRAGMEPEVSLHYSSRGGNGPLGVGWTLSSMSVITHCPKTIATEGVADGVSFDGFDRFCVDGEKLVGVGLNTYGTNNAEYRTEYDRFARIVSYTSGGAPETFKVWSKDGRISTYVAAIAKKMKQDPGSFNLILDSMEPALWYLDTVEDRSGNSMHYTWDTFATQVAPYGIEVLLKSIEYTSHALAPLPNRKVQFVYEPRPDAYFEYQGGVRFESKQRLRAIQTWAPMDQQTANPVGALYYPIEYEPLGNCSDASCRSRVSSVARCSSWNVCGWKRQFTWQHHTPYFSTEDLEEHDGDADTYALTVLDLNGDGADDVLYQRQADNGAPYKTTYARFGGPDGLGPAEQVPVISNIPNLVIQSGEFQLLESRQFDIDRDGASELYALFVQWESVNQIYTQFYALLGWDPAQGALVTIAPVTYGAMQIPPNAPSDNARILDLDGDGLPDVLRKEGPSYVYQKNLGGALAADTGTGVPASCFGRTRFVDLDGDGRGQLLGYDLGPNETACTASRGLGLDDNGLFSPSALWKLDALPVTNERPMVVFADINGDGLRDAVYPSGESATPEIALNTGNGFAPKQPIADGPFDEEIPDPNIGGGYFPDPGTRVADMNGDGIEDIVTFRYDGYSPIDSKIRMYLSGRQPSGEWGFTLDYVAQPGGVRNEDLGVYSWMGWRTSQLGDFNGDGMMDIVQLTVPEGEGGVPQHFQVLLQSEAASGDSITEVWDEAAPHPRETVQYSNDWSETAAQPSNPWPACAYPQVCVKRGFPVVREHDVSAPGLVFAHRVALYAYEDPREDLLGRGFLGFGEVRVRDPDLPQEVRTTYDHVTRVGTLYPYAGLPSYVTTIAPIVEQPAYTGNQPPIDEFEISRVTVRANTYQLRTPVPGVYFVAPLRWNSDEWEDWVQLTPQGMVLFENPSVPLLRHRGGTSTLDDFGNLLNTAEQTTGGVYRSTTSTYDNLTGNWLIGQLRSVDVAVSDPSGTMPPEPRHTELDYYPTGLLNHVYVEPSHPVLARTTQYFYSDLGLLEQISDLVQGEPVRWTYFAYDTDLVFPTERYNDLLLYETVLTDPRFDVPRLVKDPAGVQTVYDYDSFGRLEAVQPAGSEPRTITYAADDRTLPGQPTGISVLTEHDGGGADMLYSDSLGRAWERAVKGFDGGTTPDTWIHESIAFNLFGSVIRRFRPGIGAASSDTEVMVQDSLGRRVRVEQPDGAATLFSQSLFETTSQDPDGRLHIERRNKDDRITESVDLLGGVEKKTRFYYWYFDDIDYLFAPDNAYTDFTYDKLGRRTHLNDPNRGDVQFTFNGFGDLTSILDTANATPITLAHDVLGRLTTKTDYEGTTQYTWDTALNGAGKLASTSNSDVTLDFGYNTGGQQAFARWTFAGGGGSFEIDDSYDGLGRPWRKRYPQIQGPNAPPQFIVQTEYNSAGYPYLVSDASQAQTTPIYEIESRSLDLRLERRETANGVTTQREYDPPTGRLTRIHSDDYDLYYDYYPGGDVWHRLDASTLRLETFEYDDLDRLVQWNVDAFKASHQSVYHYDDAGNVTSVAVDAQPPSVRTYGQNNHPHLLASDPTGSYGYDNAGRQTSGAQRTITYTPFDLPRTVTVTGSIGPTIFRYDGLGQRVRKTGPNSDVIPLAGLYERRQTTAGVQHVFYVNGETGPVAQMTWDEGHAAWSTRYMESDATGSIGIASDEAGGAQEKLYFDPFGSRVEESGLPLQSPAPEDVKVGFTGQRHDDEFGLVDMRGRVYDPRQQRFLTPDPYIADALVGQSYNRYAYVLNNPLRYTDPSGFDPHPDVPPEDNERSVEGKFDAGAGQPPPTQPTHQDDSSRKKNAATKDGADDEGHKTPSPPAAPPADAPPSEHTFQPNAMDRAFVGNLLDSLLDNIPHISKGATPGDLALHAAGALLGPYYGGWLIASGVGRSIWEGVAAAGEPDPVKAAAGAGRAVGDGLGSIAGLLGLKGASEASAARSAARISKDVKSLGMCKQFAQRLQGALERKGISGTRIQIDVRKYGQITSDTLGPLGDPGSPHVAVKVGDMVFDSMRPGGIPYQEFLADLGVPEAVRLGAAQIVQEAF